MGSWVDLRGFWRSLGGSEGAPGRLPGVSWKPLGGLYGVLGGPSVGSKADIEGSRATEGLRANATHPCLSNGPSVFLVFDGLQ